jgi:hypothetical protein
MSSNAQNTAFYGDVLTQTTDYKEPFTRQNRPNRSSMFSNQDSGSRNKYLEMLIKDMDSKKLRYESKLSDLERKRSNFEPLSFQSRMAYGLSRKNFAQTAGVALGAWVGLKEVLPENQKKYAALGSAATVLLSAYLTGQVSYDEKLDEQEKWYETRIESIDRRLFDIARSID